MIAVRRRDVPSPLDLVGRGGIFVRGASLVSLDLIRIKLREMSRRFAKPCSVSPVRNSCAAWRLNSML